MERIEVLHQLIKSLSKGEKRKILLQTGLQNAAHEKHKKGKHYVQLFEVLDSMDQYDAKKMDRRLKARKVNLHLHNNTKYLFRFILKVLNYYYEGVHADLTNLLREIDILRQKKMYGEIPRLTSRAKALAEVHEKFSLQLELLQMEEQVLMETSKPDAYLDQLDKLYEQKHKILNKLDNLSQYQYLWGQIRLPTRLSSVARKPEDMEPLEKIMAHHLMQHKNKALSTRSLIFFYQITITYYKYGADLDSCLPLCENVINILDNNELLREEFMDFYLDKYSLIVSVFLRKQDFRQARDRYRKMTEIKSPWHDHTAKIFDKYATFTLAHCIDSGDLNHGNELVPEMENHLKKYPELFSLQKKLLWYYLISNFHFTAGDYSKALAWLNTFMNSSKPDTRSDLESFSRVMALIIHIELGNEDILEDAIRTTRRFLSRRERLFKFEDIFLRFLKKLHARISRHALLESYKDLQSELDELFKDPHENRVNDYFDIRSWLISKIENRSLAEVKQQKMAPQPA